MRKSLAELDGSELPEEALPVLIEAQSGRLYSLGLRFCGNPEEAEDMVQETFLQAYRNWNQFQGRSNPATWLYVIASHVCHRFHRKRAGEPNRLESLEELLPFGEERIAVVPDEDDGPLAERIREEGRQEIEAAIAKLPPNFRMPLILKEIVGFSLTEIAEILGTKENTVKTRLHRARLRIRKALEEALPVKEVDAPIYSKQICLDLLQAKQESLDRGVPFEFPNQVICERCSEIFATMDLAESVCRDLAHGEIPEWLRHELLNQVSPAV